MCWRPPQVEFQLSDEQGSTPATGELSTNDAVTKLMRLGEEAEAAKAPPPSAPEAEPEDTSDDQPIAAEAPEAEAESDEAEAEGETEEGDSAEEDDESKLHTVTYKGHKTQVSLQELKSGYLKDRDYRQKTQDLARERSEANAARQQADELARHYQERLSATQNDDADPDDGVDWEAESDKDPAGTQRRFFAYQKRQQTRQAKQTERQQAQQQYQAQLYHRHLQEQAPLMADVFPEWTRDESTFKRDYPKLQAYAVQEAGLPAEQLRWLTAKSWKVLAKAMRADEREAAAKKTTAAAVAAKAPAKPSVVQRPGAVVTKADRKLEDKRAVVQRAVGKKATQEDALAALTALGVR
jgi:hypothetical protein